MNSLGRAIKLLEMMGRHSGGLTNSQISRYLHISTSSTSYLLSQLEGEGCVKRDEDTGRYHVGLRLVSLAHGALHAAGFQELSGPVMYRLAGATGLTATIGVLERGEVLFIERVDHFSTVDLESTGSPWAFQPVKTTALGMREPFLESASGRVLAAFLPLEQALKLASQDARFAGDTGLLEELNQIKIQGHALVDAGGIRSVAAPILARSGGVSAALAVSGPRSSPAWADVCQAVNLVREAAFKVSRRAVNRQAQKTPELSGRFPRGTGVVKPRAEVR